MVSSGKTLGDGRAVPCIRSERYLDEYLVYAAGHCMQKILKTFRHKPKLALLVRPHAIKPNRHGIMKIDIRVERIFARTLSWDSMFCRIAVGRPSMRMPWALHHAAAGPASRRGPCIPPRVRYHAASPARVFIHWGIDSGRALPKESYYIHALGHPCDEKVRRHFSYCKYNIDQRYQLCIARAKNCRSMDEPVAFRNIHHGIVASN